MNEIICPIEHLKAEEFLEEYWQKKPLVIRQAFPEFSSPLSPEELAGLACEEDVNSRIVIEKGGDHPWQPIYGPLDDEVFASLPETHWTLLVNDVEKHLPELAWIVDHFRFIPEWRIDDLMISYAPVGGSVGPHMDLYDVFILQAEGHRRWQISTQPVAEGNQVENTPLRIQKDFQPEHEWLLAPGDIIYIPPGVSHYGVATDDCMSYSIGFRATSHADLVNDFIGYITQNLDNQLVYRDSDITTQVHSNEITEDVVLRIKQIFQHYLNTEHPELLRWLGRFMSDPKIEIARETVDQISSIEELPATVYRHPASRFAFSRQSQECLLFIDGEDHPASQGFSEFLCQHRKVNIPALLNLSDDDERELLISLYNDGKLVSSLNN